MDKKFILKSKGITTTTIFLFVLAVIALAVILAFTVPAIKEGISKVLEILANIVGKFE